MQVGFSKQMSEILIDEFFHIVTNLKDEKKLRFQNLGHFQLEKKIKNRKKSED